MLNSVTLDQLRALVAVAETGSFSGAGRRLVRVQSAISQSIQVLEAALDVRLFDRKGKRPELTDEGRAILIHARQVIADADALCSQATALSKGMEAELTLVVDSLFPSAPLLASLRALQDRFPNLPITLHTAPVMAAERRLREARASVALCCLPPTSDPRLVSRLVTHIELIPVVSVDHPLGRVRAPLPRDHVARHVQLILTDPMASPDGPSFGIIGHRLWKFVDLSSRLEFLRAGFGWCTMPSHVAAPLIAAGELVQLEIIGTQDRPRLPMYAVHTHDRLPGPAGRWFMDQLHADCASTADQKIGRGE